MPGPYKCVCGKWHTSWGTVTAHNEMWSKEHSKGATEVLEKYKKRADDAATLKKEGEVQGDSLSRCARWWQKLKEFIRNARDEDY